MIRQILSITTALFLGFNTNAQISDAFNDVLPVTDSTKKLSLNGNWKLKVEKGISDDKTVPPIDITWGEIPVPGCWEAYGFCEPSYDSPDSLTGYYRTKFTVPDEWVGNKVIIQFDGVLYGYDLWINDELAGEWRSGYNTALFDITPYINKSKQEQELALRVITTFPGSDFDYNDDWTPAGIFRDVTLMTVPDTHLSDLKIETKNNGEVKIKTKISGKDAEVKNKIYDANGKFVGTDKVENPHLWTAETPYLYTLVTTLEKQGEVLQKFENKFGFREISVDGNVLKLNGEPIKLRGVNAHSTDPFTVKVINDEDIKKDMKLMKEASINYIRTSHYPREPRFYELADSLGFYIINEVPFGYGDKNLTDESFYPILQQRAQATIRRDKNHPSILIWSLGNENPLTDICVKLGEYVRTELDSSRPYCYPQVGSYFRRFFEGENPIGFPSEAPIFTPHYPTTGQINGFYQNLSRPVIFTEYCHTLGISFEDHDRQWEIIERTPGIAGGSVWEWADQGMPFKNKKKEDIYGFEEKVYLTESDGFEMAGNKGTDGLLYANRIPLPNYYELQRNYARAFVKDSIINTDNASINFEILNRYDFLNLQDNVTFNWLYTENRDTIAEGNFSPYCDPRTSIPYTISLPNPPNENKISLLHFTLTDKDGNTFLRQSLPVNPKPIIEQILVCLDSETGDPMEMMDENFLIRAGRKATLAETIQVGDKRLPKYILRPDFNEKKAGNIHYDVKSNKIGKATHFTCSLTPDTTDTFLSELGIAFLLKPEIDRVQWIGNGPYPTYPGRFRAGRYGFWDMQKGDIYFEGNRRGVDAALLTDKEGNGILILCNNANINFEQTDKGIILSYNLAVSGQGPKFKRTDFPVMAKNAGTMEGDFYLYKVTPEQISKLNHLLKDPKSIQEPFHPFETQYDTYIMKFEDIID